MDELQLYAVTAAGLQRLRLPVNTSGFADFYDGLALGVYSALRTFDHNKFLCLDEHLNRIRRSMTLLGWTYQFDEAMLRQALHEACSAYALPDVRVRIDVLAEPALPMGTDSRILIGLMPLVPVAPHVYDEGVALAFAPGLTRRRPLVKAADFARRRQVYAEHHDSGVYEYLMLDEAGFILEGAGSNFFGVRDGVVYTAGSGVLEGITRRIILELLNELSIPVCLEAVHADDITRLDEAAISSSSRALLPVVKVEGQVIGSGRPGPVSQRILAAYNDYVADNMRQAVDA